MFQLQKLTAWRTFSVMCCCWCWGSLWKSIRFCFVCVLKITLYTWSLIKKLLFYIIGLIGHTMGCVCSCLNKRNKGGSQTEGIIKKPKGKNKNKPAKSKREASPPPSPLGGQEMDISNEQMAAILNHKLRESEIKNARHRSNGNGQGPIQKSINASVETPNKNRIKYKLSSGVTVTTPASQKHPININNLPKPILGHTDYIDRNSKDLPPPVRVDIVVIDNASKTTTLDNKNNHIINIQEEENTTSTSFNIKEKIGSQRKEYFASIYGNNDKPLQSAPDYSLKIEQPNFQLAQSIPIKPNTPLIGQPNTSTITHLEDQHSISYDSHPDYYHQLMAPPKPERNFISDFEGKNDLKSFQPSDPRSFLQNHASRENEDAIIIEASMPNNVPSIGQNNNQSKSIPPFSGHFEDHSKAVADCETSNTNTINSLEIENGRPVNQQPSVEVNTNNTAGSTELEAATATRKNVMEYLKSIRASAVPFEVEIDSFTELENSNKYYYIEKSLTRLIDSLDDMHQKVSEDPFLRDNRKRVYKYIFSLLDLLDEKLEQNKQTIKT